MYCSIVQCSNAVQYSTVYALYTYSNVPEPGLIRAKHFGRLWHLLFILLKLLTMKQFLQKLLSIIILTFDSF